MKAEGGGQKAERFAMLSRDFLDRRRGAMTLFEVLLVLVLLVVIGSLAAPLFEGSLSSIRLRRGTDQVLATWSQARTHAIEAGKIFQFRFQPGGDDYQVDPWPGGLEDKRFEKDEVNASSEFTSSNDEIENNKTEGNEFADWKYEASLPEKIVFSSAESVSQDEYGERTLTRLDQEKTAQWSAPILFFPDGTTSAASLLLKNSKNLYRRATLRALTGVARASDLLSREEVDLLESR